MKLEGTILRRAVFCLPTFLCLLVLPAHGAEVPHNDGSSWPTLHGELGRAGFYPAFPAGKLKLAWRKELHRELTGPRAEVIVGDGLAFLGTYTGQMYAWDAATGEQRWAFRAGGAIGHAPMLADGVLFFGAMDRRLYAVDARTGRERWRFEAGEGIWTSPAVHDGRVMFGARDGVFYALDAATGRLAWQFATGDRILQSASLSPDGQRVFVASEDMHLYGLAVRDGALIWKSRQLAGLSVRDYAPLVAGGLVMVTTNPVKDFHTILGENERMLVERTGFTGKDKRYIPGTADEIAREQDAIVAHLRAHPEEQVFYAFHAADGTEPWIAPMLYTGGLHNPLAPPCWNPQTGEVFTLVRSAYGVWDGGGEVRSFTGFGRLDLKTGRVALLAHGYQSKDPARPPGAPDAPWGTFAYIGDETQTLSCAPGWLFSNHQGNLGALDLATGLLTNKAGRRDTYGGFYGPGHFGWPPQGREKARAAGQPYGLVNEWHGPARAIASVAGGRVYYHTGAQVLCFVPEGSGE